MLMTVGATGGVWAPSVRGSLGLSITVQIRKGQAQREGQELPWCQLQCGQTPGSCLRLRGSVALGCAGTVLPLCVGGRQTPAGGSVGGGLLGPRRAAGSRTELCPLRGEDWTR